MQQVVNINWNDMTEAIPCFIAITMMGFAYSISDGIAFGIISYVLLGLATGTKDKMSPLMYVLAVLFVLKYILI
jgi:AGZA family xanthine/uracil permease-like MFS transporter